MLVSSAKQKSPLVLCILDGWGKNNEYTNNAIAMAKTPILDRLENGCPKALLNTSSLEVGLPKDQVGNSEVGHASIGAGRIIPQDLTRINTSISDKSLYKKAKLEELSAKLLISNGSCHLLGLLSSGGVHSHLNHMIELAKIILAKGVPVILHAILDGRDTPPKYAKIDVEKFLKEIAHYPNFAIGTVTGRYYTMDRDKRWDRIEKAWRAIQLGQGQVASTVLDAINQSYSAGATDEFLVPTVVGQYSGVKNIDGLLVANFRADRTRQILTALTQPSFDEFFRPRYSQFLVKLGMVSYSDHLDKYFPPLFPPIQLENTLGQIVSDAGLSQLRIAETEKYAHVTFFFNGGRETLFKGEKRIMVPSPNVSTYDIKPEMSATQLTNQLISAIIEDQYDLIVANFANGDMVGHTGILSAAIRAVEVVDSCLGQIEKALEKLDGTMLITADHGNCETMVDSTSGQPHTSHTTNPVPIILVGAPAGITDLANGRLSDVAPTLLALLKLKKPESMTGNSLLLGPAAPSLATAE